MHVQSKINLKHACIVKTKNKCVDNNVHVNFPSKTEVYAFLVITSNPAVSLVPSVLNPLNIFFFVHTSP